MLEVRDINLDRETAEGVGVAVLRDIALHVAPGEFVAVVGPSGCGKTTLLRLCAGLLPPTEGSVYVNGAAASVDNRHKSVVFQQDSLLPWRTIEDNIAFGLEVTSQPRRRRRATAASLAELVGLQGYEKRYPHELSGGMRQRANVARALAVDPAVLLMDEPFSALDAQTREMMQQELLRIWTAGRKTVLFVTHQIDEAVYLADRVVVLSSRPGRLLADIGVEIHRPRDLDVKLTPQFSEHVRRIWSLIEPMRTSDATAQPGHEEA